MRGLCWILLTLVSLTGCNRGKEYSPQIDFDGVAYIKVIVEDDLDSVRLDVNHSSYFPLQPCLIKRFTITNQRVYQTSYNITRPELVRFEFKDTVYTAYMLPGDTLVARIGLFRAGVDSNNISFHVDGPVFDFMQNELKEFGCFYYLSPLALTAFNNPPATQKEFDETVGRIDQAQQVRLEFLENNHHNLPEWFQNLYKHNTTYYSANMKFFQYFYLKNRNLKGILMPCDVEINNPGAVSSAFYWQFIADYLLLSDSVDHSLTGPPRAIAYYNKATHNINSQLKGKILEYFNSYLLSVLYYGIDSRKDLQLVDSLRDATDFGLTAQQERYIDKRRSESLERLDKLEDANRLKPGSKAAYFYLKDSAGVFHKLSDYSGKLIYLHFWATWCGPCLEEIPSLNRLAESLAGKPVEIINICLDDEYEKWQSIIANEQLKGINLICAGNWSNHLQEKYSVKGIPHYAIIDRNGIIISENCERPDKAYERLLAHIEK
ncbi:MAG: TlpA family protein disulfide reductase [Bacteroidales bacterium]|nr:TlpA family protein disulfide reductase [Bacteroidales bacterium]